MDEAKLKEEEELREIRRIRKQRKRKLEHQNDSLQHKRVQCAEMQGTILESMAVK